MKYLNRLFQAPVLVFFGNYEIYVHVRVDEISVGRPTNRTFNAHQAVLFRSLENGSRVEVLRMTWVLYVGPYPTYILASTKKIFSFNSLHYTLVPYLLNPHFRKHTLPMSNPSELPHHKNTKLRCAATSPTSRFMIWSHDQNCMLVAPIVLWYSSRGGSIRMTSNLLLMVLRS